MKNKILSKAYGGVTEARHRLYGLGLPRQWKVITSTLLLLFTFAIGNVWAADPTHTNPATVTYGGKTFLDAANTPGNAGTENVYLNYGVIGMYNNLSTFTWLTYDKFDKSNNSYTLPSGAVGFCTPGSSSSSEFYGNVNFNTNNKTSWMKVYVTGTEEIGFIWENNNTTNNRFIVYSLSEIDSEGEPTGTPQTTTGKSPLATGKQYDKFTGLSHSKYYCLTISTEGASSSKFYSITFKRYVAPLGYSITYHCNGATSGCPSDVASGATALPSTLATPAKTGYDFDKWYTDEGLTTPATAGATLSANANLYAGWTAHTHSLTWNIPVDATITNSETYTHGTVAYGTAIVAPTLSRTGYDFLGWDVTPAATMPDNDLTYTATWQEEAQKFDITYSNLKESDVSAYPTKYSKGIGIASFAPLADVEGFHFTGWSPASISTTDEGNINIEAQWTPTYSVTYNLNGGTGTLPTETAKYATQEFTLAAQGDIVAPANKQFLGWKDQDGNKYAAEANFTMPGKAVTLTAYWAAKVEDVIYLWEGAASGATEVGGTASSTRNAGTAYTNEEINANTKVHGGTVDYYCLCLSGKADYSDKFVKLALAQNIQAGDKVEVTAFYNKKDDSTGEDKTANARPQMHTMSGTVIFVDPDNLPNLNTSGSPAVRTFTVPSGINTDEVKMTRNQTGSNTWIAKLRIYRESYIDEDLLKTVTFNYNDGVTPNATIQLASGQAVAKPADPTRAHYRFHEWQLSGVAYDFSTAVTSNITLTADWTQLYTVTYAKGEESATGDAPTQDELAAGEKFTVAANTFAYEGHDFSTWNDGSKDVAPASEYTMGAANVTLTAQWITATTKVTVTYKDGETTLGSEEITINTGNPVGYATYQTRNLATFDGWYNDPDLAEGHKIADISALTASANVNVYGKWTYNYASSVNIEQWTLTNGAGIGATTKTSALISAIGSHNFAHNLEWVNKNLELDSLNDAPGKTNRNYAYLGLKVKVGGKMVDFRLAKDSYVKVKFGNVAATPKVSINGADYADMEITDGVYSYTATGNDYISIKTADANAVVFKQIMINEPIADVTLPWRVTYDANGGTCSTAEAIWSGAALILPDVTPADVDHTFAGWYDEVSGGSLQGVAGASYSATDNITLHAQFAPVEYAIAYDGNGATSGSMTAGAAGWGTLVTPDANAFVKSGNVFSGWVITKTSDGSATGITFSEGKFEMPKYDVTLVAQWDDASKVVKIVETGVKYESFAAAIAAVQADQTIQLLQDCEYSTYWDLDGSALTGTKTVTLDLNGKNLTYTGSLRGVQVRNGAKLILMDGTATVAPTIDLTTSPMARTAISYTSGTFDSKDGMCALAGSEIIINSGRYLATEGVVLVVGNAATVTVNDGVLISRDNGVLMGNGTNSDSYRNYVINVHGGILYGEIFSAGYASMAIYHPNIGTLNIDGGILVSTNGPCVVTRGGASNITGGTLVAIGGGSGKCGDASLVLPAVGIAVDFRSAYPGVASTDVAVSGTVDVTGQAGAVEAVYAAATPTATEESKVNISGGTFNTELTTDLCAPGYIPSAEVAPGVYTVVPKDGVEIIGVVTTGGTNKTVTGLYKGDASVDLDNTKKLADGKYIFVTLKEGYTFEETDVLIIDLAAKSDLGGGTKALEITTGIGNIDGAVWKSIAFEDYDGSDTISLEGIAPGQTSIGLKRSTNQNAKVNGIKVLRPMKPMLTAITINGRDGEIDALDDKHFTVTIPNDANLASLTIVPTIVRNAPHATTPEQVMTNSGAWVLTADGDNTYRIMDKDGDYTDYTITLIRDVLKHTVRFMDGASVYASDDQVEDGATVTAPATDPTKDEYIFKGWSETVDGEVISDWSAITITADKDFYAIWEAEPAGIKLFTDLGLNTTNFISAAKATDSVEINTVKYPYLVAFGSNRTSLAEAKQADLVMYSATTDATKIKFDLYNTNESAKTAYVWLVEEGDVAATQLDAIEVAGTTRVKTAYYEFNGTKNRTVYLTSGAKADIKVLQAKVIESGSAIHQFGQAGYVVDFNKGRIAGAADGTVSFEGAAITMKSDYKVLNSTSLSPKTYIQFNNPVANTIVKIKRSGSNKYYVTNDLDNKGTEYSSDQEITLTATGTWYIGSVNPGSAAQITKIEFIAPKCAEPQFNALANSDLCEGDAFVALNGTATVADAGTPIYQWYNADGDVKLTGETNPTYTPTADGSYYVIATNQLAGYSDNEKKSATVTVTHFASAEITSAPANVRKDAGVAATLTVVATGKDLHYTWKECATIDGTYTDVSGAADAASLNVTVPSGVKYYKVVVSSACGDAVEAIAKVEEWTELPQVHISATTEWDLTTCADAEIKLTSTTSPKKGEECLMANIEGVHLDANFNSQALVMSGEYIYRNVTGKPTCAEYMKFITDVEGVVTVTFAGNGADRLIRVTGTNGVQYSTVSTGTGDTHTEKFFVTPGEVELMGMDEAKTQDKRYMRFFNITFTAEPNYTRDVTEGRYGTICLPNGGVMVGAELYEVAYYDGTVEKIFLDEVLNGEMVAGRPYIFLTKEGVNQIAVYYTDEEDASAGDYRGLFGSYSKIHLAANDNIYILKDNRYYFVDSDNVYCGENRAYFKMGVAGGISGSYVVPAPGRKRMSIGAGAPKLPTGIENTGFESEAPRKVLINGELYIIRGEKMYDAKGQLVK